MDEKLIIEEINNNKEEYIKLLSDLIKAESYNPPGNEKNVALILQDYLEKNNIECEIFPFGDNRANLIAYLNKNFDGKNLLYNGHMDVVPAGDLSEWKYPPLSAFIKRNKIIYGRGTTDMKGALAAMIVSLKILKKLNFNYSRNLILTAVADEETGGELGTKWLLENKLNSIKCDFCVIGESTGLNPLPKAIILGEKGRIVIKIVTNGISAHASMPSLGHNAIYMMSEIIQNLEKLDNYFPNVDPPFSINELKEFMSSAFPNKAIFEKIYDEQPLLENLLTVLTHFTNCLSVINGGIKDNVVADRCEALIDFRVLPGQTVEDILDGLRNLIKDIGYSIKDQPSDDPEKIFVYLEVKSYSPASVWKNWKTDQYLTDLFNVIENVFKKKPFFFIFPASTDAHFLRNTNYCEKTIVFGPGSSRNAHTNNENLEIQDFINAIKVYTLFAYNFLKK